MCEVRVQYGNSTVQQTGGFYTFFLLNSTLYLSILLFSLLQPLHEAEPLALNPKELVL